MTTLSADTRYHKISTDMDNERKDHWSTEAYQNAAGFVPKLTTTVVSYLDAQPNDAILDLGCGDGVLTAQIAGSCQHVLGVDASKSFIDTAKKNYASIKNCSFLLHDATELENCSEVVSGQWDKVFSNAAMHWILRKESTRKGFFGNVHKALKRGGTFVFEMGGKGNVAEIHAASIGALVHAGIPLQTARGACPWFFPSSEWMEKTLGDAGFEVLTVEREYRPSLLKTDSLEAWVELMCAEFLEYAPPEKRKAVVEEICDVIETIIVREEDGSKYLGYVRCRAVAKKK